MCLVGKVVCFMTDIFRIFWYFFLHFHTNKFIKCCKVVVEDLTTVLNYIIKLWDFPEMWPDRLQSITSKSMQRNVTKN